jgi:hypothetical protein
MAERHGKNSRVIIDSVVVKMATLNLNMTKDKVEVTAFGDTNKRYVVGLKDFAADFSGFWDDATDKLFDVADLDTPVNVYLYPDAVNAPTQYWWGSAYVDASVTSGVSAAVGVSGTVTAAGNFTRSGLP